MTLRVAIDIGGTFTDLLAFDDSSQRVEQAKSLTTPADPVEGVIDCIRKAGMNARAAMDHLIHGSTTAINTLIERKGAKVGLIVTRGTRDVYRIGRGNRPEAYNLFFHRPRPLVPRHLTIEVDGRLYASGEVREPLHAESVQEACAQLAREGVEAIAVCLLHSYANPEHELCAGQIIEQALPGCYVSLSHKILREYREYERTSTTVVNAYIGPKVGGYVRNLSSRLKEIGFRGELAIMQSNGGVMTPQTAIRRPVTMMESGPVGGIIASAAVGKALGYRDVVSFDMGGTTAKTSLVRSGEPTMADGYYVGGYASGDPVMVPVVDVVEVGAGGGSIAWIDEVGALKVGPQSSGADPGPIAYGRGGQEPTITDANVVLGRIGVSDFLGGEMRLDGERALQGLTERIAKPLGMDATTAARAVVQIAVAKMSLAVREVSVEKGYDPRDFALVASGGAGPVHAVAIGRELHIPTVIIPRFPAHFSALGMLMADERHDFIRTHYSELTETDFAVLASIYRDMAAEAEKLMTPGTGVVHQILLDLRYVGQEFTLPVPVSREQLQNGDAQAIRATFDAMHEQQYAHHSTDERVEIVNMRLVALGQRSKLMLPPLPRGGRVAPSERRRVDFDQPGDPIDCPVYRRENLPPGAEMEGPALVGEYGSTTVLFPGDRLSVAETGELIISLRRE
ncbi:MAG TPA: hydantoinase/oxoprolinase family protein [Patescibacteria group bacterium]|nr:hydantoinase/oxoprolinase family protein [Patescibacteria group bacterium]